MSIGITKSLLKFTSIIGLSLGLAACGDSNDGLTKGNYKSASETQIEVAEGSTGHFGDIVYGSKDAPVEIIEYASLTCPGCQYFEENVFPEIKKKYIDTGKVRFVFRNFLLNSTDLQASALMRCRDEDFARTVKSNLYGRFNTWLRSGDPAAGLAKEARRLGLPRTRYDKCLSNKDIQLHLSEMKQVGIKEYEVNATPTIIVNGGKLEDYSIENIDKLVAAATSK